MFLICLECFVTTVYYMAFVLFVDLLFASKNKNLLFASKNKR